MRSFPTLEERFKYNLLGERINELNMIQASARRANPELCTEHVRIELHCAIAFLNGWQLGMAAQSCEQAEHLFLAERRRLAAAKVSMRP
jgi:hypothetical protein